MQKQLAERIRVVVGLIGFFSLGLGIIGYMQETIARPFSVVMMGFGAAILLMISKSLLAAKKMGTLGMVKGPAMTAEEPSDPLTLVFNLLGRIIDKISDQQLLLIAFGLVLIGMFAYLDEKDRWLGILVIGAILIAFIWKVRDFQKSRPSGS